MLWQDMENGEKSMYKVTYASKAKEHLRLHEESGNLPLVRKISSLITELKIHPRTGTGKPEPLKYGLAGQWSRRINNEHRLIYTIEDNVVKIVNVLSAKGHY